MAWTPSDKIFGSLRSLFRGPKPAVASSPRIAQCTNVDNYYVKKTTWKFGHAVQLIWVPMCKIHKMPKIQHILLHVHWAAHLQNIFAAASFCFVVLNYILFQEFASAARDLSSAPYTLTAIVTCPRLLIRSSPTGTMLFSTVTLFRDLQLLIIFMTQDKNLDLGRRRPLESIARVAEHHRTAQTWLFGVLPAGWAGSSP